MSRRLRLLFCALFLACALPTGLGCALLTPIDMFPDEPAHIARADGLRYGEIFGVNAPHMAPGDLMDMGVTMNAAIFRVMLSREFVEGFPDRPVSAAARAETAAIPWTQAKTYCPTQMDQYFPVFYAPAALGLWAGEAAGLSPLNTVYLGRLAMFLAFAALGTLALGLARHGQALLFAILILPSLVNLAASFNQDGVMISACALAAALLTRQDRPSRAAALALLTALACAKTPYAPLLLAWLIPLRAPGLARRLAILLLALSLPALWLAHTVHWGFIHYPRAPYHPGPLYPGRHDIWLTAVVPADNLAALLAHPLQIIWLPITSFALFWHATWPLLLGCLSWGNTLLPGWEYPLLAIALCTAALGTALAPSAQSPEDAALAGAGLFAAFIGIELSLYLTFTEAGLGLIQGVNSRYFLPLLPFLILVLPRAPHLILWPRLQSGWFALPAIALAGSNIYALPAFIHQLYRMPWW